MKSRNGWLLVRETPFLCGVIQLPKEETILVIIPSRKVTNRSVNDLVMSEADRRKDVDGTPSRGRPPRVPAPREPHWLSSCADGKPDGTLLWRAGPLVNYYLIPTKVYG